MRMNVRQLRQHHIARELDRSSSKLAHHRNRRARRRGAVTTDKPETRPVKTIITARINLIQIVGCGEVRILDARTTDMIEEELERGCYVFRLARPREIAMTCFRELFQQRVIRITSQTKSEDARGTRIKSLQNLFYIPRTESG